MSGYVLGLDLGSNSIGWAVVNEEAQQLIDTGVRVFPEGVDRDQTGGEQSKSEKRRIARGMRRQIARRARRKKTLRRSLVQAGLLPEVAMFPVNDSRRVEWERDQFRQADPYSLRSRALKERLEPYELGRVFLHLNQRRGFFSNRKADRQQKKENSEMLKEISALAAEMHERTLGEYLESIRSAQPLARVRGKHTRREMLHDEFEAIWDVQRQFHPQLLTDERRYGQAGKQVIPRDPIAIRKGTNPLQEFGFFGIIFFQRPMYWPKSVIGACELEPKQKRCPRADRVAQRFRLLQEVNNLRILEPLGSTRSLTDDERTKLILFLSKSKEKTFDEIRKHLGLLENYGFNLEAGDRRKLLGMPTDKMLSHKELFGPNWYSRSEQEKNSIVRILIDGDEDRVRALALSEWGLNIETAERLLDVDLGEGYSSLSRQAIEKLLPFLEQGVPLMSRDGLPSALEKAGYLRPDQRVVNERPLLPDPPDVTNPIVRQALHEVRKVVNAIIREYGKPAAIHIELARDVKGTSEMRHKQTMEMRDREKRREKAAERIREHGDKATREKIEKYLLWEEQDHICMYSGKPISLAQLLGGEAALDHILPYSQSLDNSLMNKVVCLRDENDAKGQRTPYQWLADIHPQKYEAILQRAAKLPYEVRNRKRPKFSQKAVVLSEFINRQLVDTAYITSKVAEYVRCLGADVVCSKGQLTAELRYRWGLHSVLRDDGLNLKSREDHRHHAIDAIVIALTNRSRLQQLARTRGTDESLPEPWPNFLHAVEAIINNIAVSHRTTRKVAGALHEETNYGPTFKPHRKTSEERPWATNWIEREGEFVYRKTIESLTLTMIDDIRDPDVKRIISERLLQFGLTAGGKGTIPKEAWKEPLYLIRKSGRTSTQPAIIKKVRLIKRDQTIRPIRSGTTFVKPGSLHHTCIFEITDSKGRTRRDAVYVSMLEAMQRVQDKKPLIQRVHPQFPDARFIMSLSPGDMLLAEFQGTQRPVVVTTLVSTQKRIHIVDANDARPGAKKKNEGKSPNSLQGRKIVVDPLGRIRWAND